MTDQTNKANQIIVRLKDAIKRKHAEDIEWQLDKLLQLDLKALPDHIRSELSELSKQSQLIFINQ